MDKFKLKAPFSPSGDQPQAIQKLVEGFDEGLKEQVLLGVTGSLAWYYAAYLFALGTAFGFAQVCLATAIDFRRPHFAVAKGNAEEGNTVRSVAI